MTKIKICGIQKVEEILFLNKQKPDYVGFVFAKSKRQVNFETAKKLKNNLDKSIKSVGVFVNHDIDEIFKLINENVINCVQFHGNETEDDIKNIKKTFPKISVFKAVTVNSLQDILNWNDTLAEFLLLDNGKGGTGEKFDWAILKEIKAVKKPYFIAGGLNAENVKDVLKFTPYGVDVSGGVETDGIKDMKKMGKFIENVRKNDE